LQPFVILVHLRIFSTAEHVVSIYCDKGVGRCAVMHVVIPRQRLMVYVLLRRYVVKTECQRLIIPRSPEAHYILPMGDNSR